MTMVQSKRDKFNNSVIVGGAGRGSDELQSQ